MKTAIALLISASVSASGQINGLSTIRDGSAVLFTAPLRLQGAGHPPLSNTYRADSTGFHLEASSRLDQVVEFSSISADGTVRVDNFTRPCTGLGASLITCDSDGRQSAVVRVNGVVVQTLSSHGRVSSSGRYVLIGAIPLAFRSLTPALVPRYEVSRLDLQTGVTSKLGGVFPGRDGTWIAADGTAVVAVRDDGGLFGSWRWVIVYPNGERKDIGAAGTAPVMADDASYLLNGNVMQKFDGTSRVLLDGAAVAIAADSQKILYLRILGDIKQAFVAQLSNPTSTRQVTFDPDGISSAVISGDGNWAYATTGNGRLIKVDLRKPSTTELIGRTFSPRPVTIANVYPDFRLARFASGSIQDLFKFVRDAANLEPIVPSESGLFRVYVGDLPAPAIAENQIRVTFQVPWEAKSGANEVVTRWDNSTWEAAYPVEFCEICPSSITGGAIHEDWRGRVTEKDPALPGEIVYLYAFGLGPVQPPVPTGTITPSVPLSVVSAPCRARAHTGQSLEVLFAGLAPETIGYHLLILRIPTNWSSVATNTGLGVFVQCGDAPEAGLGFVFTST